MEHFYMEETDGLKTLKCRALDEIPWLRHGFSTRHGGVSQGDYASLSFSYQKEAEAIVDENFRRFCNANAMPFDSLVLTHQTHTANVATVNEAYRCRGRDRSLRETDGVVTAAKDLGLVCFTADCVPILLADPQAKVIAAVHAGWRGTVQSIGARVVEAMVNNFGCDPANIRAAIGPNIGQCHFETDADVPEAVRKAFGPEAEAFIEKRGEKYHLDLKRINALVLRRAGVRHIEISEDCTYCQNRRFWSHRVTKGDRGSQGAVITCKEGMG